MKVVSLIFFFFIQIQLFSQNIAGKWIANYQFLEPQKVNIDERDYSTNNLFFKLELEEIIDKKYDENGYPIDYFMAKLINPSKSKYIPLQDGSLFIIQEAKDSLGNWKPIEKWFYSDCGNSYTNGIQLKRNNYISIPIRSYKGTIKTEVRLKLRIFDELIYSDSFEGYVDENQFYELDKKSALEENFFKPEEEILIKRKSIRR